MNSIIEFQIMEKAKRRIGFKIHFAIFVLLLPLNWPIWYFTDTIYMWPIWPTLGWGLGIFFHWLAAFHADKFFSLSKEYKDQLNRQLQARKERYKQ
jgi:energy-coupling factor transporter transmembrane protein EcfT